MIKREKILYSFFLTVTVALASTVAFLYVNLQNSQASLAQKLALERYQKAYAVFSGIEKLASLYYHCYSTIQDDDYMFAHGSITNETRDELYFRTIHSYFGSYYSPFYDQSVQNNINSLAYLYGEPTYEEYHNVSDTIQYTLDQIDFATLGRTINESRRLIGELYYVLGIDQVLQGGNWTALRGIAWSFFTMSSYWDTQYVQQSLTNATPPIVAFGWARANATQLYEDLVIWHDSNPRPPWVSG